METKFLRLLFDYSKNGKFVDKAYIEQLIDIVINSQSLNFYVSKCSILNEGESLNPCETSLASYDPTTKTINVYIEGIKKTLEHHEKYQILFHNIEQLFFQNLVISQVILHELEHAHQAKIMDQENTLEANILRASKISINSDEIADLVAKGYEKEQILIHMLSRKRIAQQNYRTNYLLAPNERLAEINSYQEILNSLSHIKEYVPNLTEFEQSNKLESLLRGFDYEFGFLNSPTLSYLSKNGNPATLSSFDWYDKNYFKCLEKTKKNYPLEDRLKYGLMIDDEEFDQSLKMLKLSKKYQCN